MLLKCIMNGRVASKITQIGVLSMEKLERKLAQGI